MGYYTQYTLDVYDCPEKDKASLVKEIEKLNVFEPGGCFECGWSGYMKWYDHDRDMALLSTRFPDAVFQLDGDGEEDDDTWRCFYKNGMIQDGALEVIRIERPFDATKLRELMDPLRPNDPYSYQTSVN